MDDANYDLSYEGVSIFCDNTSVISLSKYITHQSRTKNMNFKHHFIEIKLKMNIYI